METKTVTASQLFESAVDGYILEKILPKYEKVVLEYDSLDKQWHSTIKLKKEEVEDSEVPLCYFYTDNEDNYYYPVAVENIDA